MNLRQAILNTARVFETRPELFQFTFPGVPHCGTPGCALGVIGAFLDFKEGTLAGEVAARLIPTDSTRPSEKLFYDRMDDLVGLKWIESPELCAQGLRLYADKYHPPEFHELDLYDDDEFDRIFAHADAPLHT